jgi:diacylglycerol kinase (ATP)
MPKHSIFMSFGFAFQGIAHALKERNFVLHIVSTILVVLLGFLFHVTTAEWCILILCTGVVLTAELVNTAIEKLVNMVSPEFNPRAGEIKDIAAAAVLVFSIASAIIALLIFVPYAQELFQ